MKKQRANIQARGKYTCKILKEIRRQIADANGIEFETSECHYNGDCLGTCPKCEAEVRYLEKQLRARSLAGKAIALAAISAASLAIFTPLTSQAQSSLRNIQMLPSDSISATCADSIKVKGIVKCEYTTKDDSIATEELIGATVVNLTNGKGITTDIDGKFVIEACKGDSIQAFYIGCPPETVCVKDPSETIQIMLTDAITSAMPGEVVVVSVKREERHYVDLNVTDEKGNVIDREDLSVEHVWIDEDGDEDYELVLTEYFDEKHPCRIYWDYGLQDEEGKALKEVTLRIVADGYDVPVTIKVKYPKRNAKKTIKFKHNKK